MDTCQPLLSWKPIDDVGRPSCAVRVAVQSWIHPTEEAAHLANWPDWDKLDPILVAEDIQLLAGAESQSLSDLLRYDDLELWRESYLSHMTPPFSRKLL